VSSIGSPVSLSDNITSEVTGSYTNAQRIGLGPTITFRNDTGVNYAKIGAFCDSDCSNNQSALGFWTENNATVFNATNTKMIITQAGNVGIGTTNPTTKLQVGAATSSMANLLLNGAGGGMTPDILAANTSGTSSVGVTVLDGTDNRRAGLFVDETNGLWGLTSTYSNTAAPFVIRGGIAATERFRIDNFGDVGIGTTTPAFKLDVNGTVAGNILDRGGQVVNVKAYGAKGDGSTPDQAAFTAAFAAGTSI